MPDLQLSEREMEFALLLSDLKNSRLKLFIEYYGVELF